MSDRKCVLSGGSCKAGDCPVHGTFPRREGTPILHPVAVPEGDRALEALRVCVRACLESYGEVPQPFVLTTTRFCATVSIDGKIDFVARVEE